MADTASPELEHAQQIAAELSIDVVSVDVKRPLVDVLKARTGDGAEVALHTINLRASKAERARFADAASRMQDLGARVPGLLRVRALSLEGDAFVADRHQGTAQDLGALRWPVKRKIEFVRKVLVTLDALHQAGQLHGCLSMSNVLLDGEFDPVLDEVGMVSALESFGGDRENVFGYGAFLAPEAADGRPERASDVYAAGRLLLAIVLECDPAKATPEAVAAKVPALAGLAKRCITESPLTRFQTAGEVIAELDALAPKLEAVQPLGAWTGEPKKPAAAAPKRADAKPAPEPLLLSLLPSLEPLRRPLGGLGLALAFVAIALAAALGCPTPAMRASWQSMLAVGGGLALLLFPAYSSRPILVRAILVFGGAAALRAGDPLFFLERTLALKRLSGGGAARAMAAAELVTLGHDLHGASLAHVDMSGLDMRGADLRAADLTGANLERANLFGAMFDGAALKDARLYHAVLAGSSLADARDPHAAACDDTTVLPSGWRCDHGHPTEAPPDAPSDASQAAPAPPAPPPAAAQASAQPDTAGAAAPMSP
jgi:hypothetical protein